LRKNFALGRKPVLFRLAMNLSPGFDPLFSLPLLLPPKLFGCAFGPSLTRPAARRPPKSSQARLTPPRLQQHWYLVG